MHSLPVSADDMGLGKTLSTISLLVVKKQEDRQTIRKVQGVCSSSSGGTNCLLLADLISINATLIVVPASLMHMWEAEIKSKVKPGVLRVKIYHGSSRPKDPSEWVTNTFAVDFQCIYISNQPTVVQCCDYNLQYCWYWRRHCSRKCGQCIVRGT